ncbi:MAG TPA: hypothetical protein VNF08_01360 [Acidimicrobiales bacterium]|nr:hypothetical protein [Acidimicrobiales bacterium]
MIRALGALFVGGLLLSACGSISAVSALRSWVVQSGYRSSATTLVGDARHAADVLNISTASNADLHTVCGVLLVDTESANASLPTPDARATTLLSKAYTNLGAGANECYVASTSVRARAKALKSLASGLADLSEGSARITSASAP